MKRRSLLKSLVTGAAAGAVTRRELAAQERAARATRGMPSPRIKDVQVIATSPNGLRLVVVKVVTDQDGLYGYGCGTFTQRADLVVAAVEKYLKPFLAGKPADRIDDIWQACYNSSYWRNGPVLNNAISGVDQALWDIKGRMAGMPVYQLLGGKCREAADCYAHASGREIPEVIDNARKLMAQGFRHIRVQVGVPGQAGYGAGAGAGKVDKLHDAPMFEPEDYLRRALKLLETARKELGDEVELLPPGRRARVRSIEIYHEPADRARAGHRTALNLAGYLLALILALKGYSIRAVQGLDLPSNWLVNRNWADQSIMGVTSALSSNLVNDFRFAYHYWNNRNAFPTEKECPGCIGLGMPSISIQGSGVTVGNTTNAPQGRDIRRFNIVENATWQKGAHRVRFGGTYENSPFNGYWAFGEPAASNAFGPDLLIQNRIPISIWGLPQQFRTNEDLMKLPLAAFAFGLGDPGQPPPFNAQNARNNRRYHFFGQDSWRVRPNLTLNYGLAWQFESTLNNHDLDKPAFLAPIMDSIRPTKKDWNNLSPSLGFAWSVGRDNKTVVRGGFGVYYDTRELSQRLGERAVIGPVGNGRQQIVSTAIPNPLPTIPSPAPGLPAVPTGAPLFFTLPTGFTVGTMMQILPQVKAEAEARLRNPNPNDLSVRNINVTKQGTDLFQYSYPASYSRHTTLGVQRQITTDLVLTADFVYRHFYKQEIGTIDYNRFNRVQGPVIPRCTGAQANDPSANCSTGPIEFRAPIGRTDYKALLVKVDKRFARRYQFTISYALARQYGLNGITNLDNWFETWGPQGGRHNLNVSGIVDLPWRFQVSFISSIGTRGPYRPSVSGVDLDGDGLDTAFLPGWIAPDRKPTRERLEAAVAAWNAAYPDLPNGQRPRTSRNQVIPRLALPAEYSFGENFSSQDLRLTKTFAFTERYRLAVFGEVFNVLNIANLGGISSTVNSAGFGVPTSRASQVFGSGGPRAFQFGARFSF